MSERVSNPFAGRPLTLIELAAMIEARIEDQDIRDPEPTAHEGFYDWIRRRRAFAEALLVELADDDGCRFKIDGCDTSRMRLAGISISCAGGPLQMLTGWCRKARAAAEARL